MDRAEAIGVLLWAAATDPRLKPTDPTEVEFRQEQWTSALADVPIQFAKRYVDRFYSHPENLTVIRPGFIRTAWVTERERLAAMDPEPQRALESGTREPVLLPDGSRVLAPAGFAEFVAKTQQEWTDLRAKHGSHGAAFEKAAADLRARINARPVPWTATTLRDDSRERRCSFHRVCVCDHRSCFDGWLDEPNDEGRVERCPRCREAIDMAGELTPPRRGRR